MNPMDADPDKLTAAGKKAMALQGNHEGYLKSMLGLQDEMMSVVKSPGGGAAIQQALTDTWHKGSALAKSMQGISETMIDTANKIGSKDLDNYQQVLKGMGGDHHSGAYLASDGTNSVGGDITGADFNGDKVVNPGKVDVQW